MGRASRWQLQACLPDTMLQPLSMPQYQSVKRPMIALAAALFLAAPAFADITGQPRVIDGDTLEIHGHPGPK